MITVDVFCLFFIIAAALHLVGVWRRERERRRLREKFEELTKSGELPLELATAQQIHTELSRRGCCMVILATRPEGLVMATACCAACLESMAGAADTAAKMGHGLPKPEE